MKAVTIICQLFKDLVFQDKKEMKIYTRIIPAGWS